MKELSDLSHVGAGIIVGLIAFVKPVLAVLATILFIIYELDEDWHLHDKAYKDIFEFALGFYATLVAYLILSFFEVIPLWVFR